MKTASPDLIALLNSSTQFRMADLFTITLVSGVVVRYTSADLDIAYGGQTYSAQGPLIRRGTVRVVKGLEVDTLDLTVSASASNSAHTLEGAPFIQAALKGSLDGATVLLQRAFMADWGSAPAGVVVLFSGRVSDVSGSRTEARVVVKSDIELLNIRMPRNLYQAPCLHTVYDSGCAASKSAKQVLGRCFTSPAGSDGRWLKSNRTEPTGWFNQGVLTFTSGVNMGVKRTVKTYSGGLFYFALPLPRPPAAGDSFLVYPGCDKTQATCQAKFNNLARFRGYPYIPIPETVI